MKVILDADSVIRDLPGILLLSHSDLAVAMVHTVEFICGKTDNLAAFSFEEEDSPEEYCAAFSAALQALPAGSIVLTDIFGGSPCNQLMIHARKNGLTVFALAGMSLPMVVSAINHRDDCAGEALLAAIKQESKEFIVDVTEKLNQ